MIVKTLLIILVAFIAYMHSYVGSTMHNRPIIVAPMVGLVLGDLQTGIIIGATLELVFLGAFPVGASNPPDFVSGTIIAASYIIMSGQDIGAAVALAVPIATLVLLFDNFLMTFVLTQASHIADKYAEKGDIAGVEKTQRIAAIGNKVILACVVGLGFYLGVPLIEVVLNVIPEFIIHGMDVAAGILPAIGFAMLARMMMSKELLPFLIGGFLLSAYLGVPVLGIALFGVAIAMNAMNKKETTTYQEVQDDNEF